MATNNLDSVTEFLVKQRMGGDSDPSAAAGEAPEDATPLSVPEAAQDEPPQQIEEEQEEQEEQEEAQEHEEEEGEPATEFIDVDDDDLIEVRVEGEVKQVTLRELKNAFGGEGAIAKRLQDATEERKAAQAERAKVAEEGETARQAMMAVIQQLDNMLHKPTVAPPDASLKQSNPRAYLQQMDAYQQEAQALEQSRQLLIRAFQEHANTVEQQKKQRQQSEAQLLAQHFEPIRDPKTRQAAANDIKQAVAHYGFTDADMKTVIDHRLYMMAYDAMQYHKLRSKGKTQLGELREKAEKTRTLRTKPVRRKQTNAEKKAKILRSNAQKSGRTDDVAAFMLHNRQNRGK